MPLCARRAPRADGKTSTWAWHLDCWNPSSCAFSECEKWRETMAYQAEISRKNPGCFLFLIDQTVKFPVWFDPYWKGGTPMCAALKEATRIVETWCQERPTGFPPIIINITDGEATDGDLVAEARKLTAVGCDDGSVLLFNIHLSSTAGPSIELPTNANKLPDQHAKQLFEASSTLTPFMVARANELGMSAAENSRGFIFNAQPLHVIHFLDIGTRPANVHLR